MQHSLHCSSYVLRSLEQLNDKGVMPIYCKASGQEHSWEVVLREKYREANFPKPFFLAILMICRDRVFYSFAICEETCPNDKDYVLSHMSPR